MFRRVFVDVVVPGFCRHDHGVDDDIPHVCRAALLDIPSRLRHVGRIGLPQAWQRAVFGKRIGSDENPRVGDRPPSDGGAQHEGRAVGEVEPVECERPVLGDGSRGGVAALGYQQPHRVAVELLLFGEHGRALDASRDLLSRLQRVIRLLVFVAQELRHVVPAPALRKQQFVEPLVALRVVGREVPVGVFDHTAQLGREHQRGVDARRRYGSRRLAVGDGDGEVALCGSAFGVVHLEMQRYLRTLLQRALLPHRHLGLFVAAVEDQPLGVGFARGAEQQDLVEAARQFVAQEGERCVLRVPLLVVALRAAAVDEELQSLRPPLFSRTDGYDEGGVVGLDAQDEGEVVGLGQIEAPRLAARCLDAFGRVAPAGPRRELERPHAGVARGETRDGAATVVAHGSRHLPRKSVLAQGLEPHAAGLSVDEVAAFGEEGHVEGACRRAAPSFFGLSVGIDRKGFREEIVAAEVAHVERVGAQHVFVLRERRGQRQVAGIDAAALQNLDAAHEQVVRRAKLHVDVAARRERFERRGVDAVRTQPHRVARDIGVAVGRHVELLLRKITDLLQKRVLLRVQQYQWPCDDTEV